MTKAEISVGKELFMKKEQKKNNDRARCDQVIESTSTLINVDYVPVDDVKEIKALERGENGWREASVEKGGLVRCTSPIRGTVYRVLRFGSTLDEYYVDAMVRWILGSKKGRVFANAEGVLRVVFDLPKEDLEALLVRIMIDTYEQAGYKV